MTPGYPNGDYETKIQTNLPPLLSNAGYALIPPESKYTLAQVAALAETKRMYTKNYLAGSLAGELHFGGGKSSSLIDQLSAAYGRSGALPGTSPLPEASLWSVLSLTDEVKTTMKYWLVDDKEFARARLGGINPVQIRRYQDGDPLPDGMKSDNLYVCDYRDLKKYVPKLTLDGRYLYPCFAVFGVDGQEGHHVLMPRALQVGEQWCFPPPAGWKQDSPEWCRWLLAKMHVATADALYHEFGPHLGTCHLVTESIVIATYQSFSRDHPIFKLLRPHFKSIATINFAGVKALLSPGEVVDQIMSGGRVCGIQAMSSIFADWTLLERAVVESDLIYRGVQDIPVQYPFRDDAISFYNEIHKFVEAIVNATYSNISVAKQDTQLMQWWKALTQEKIVEGGPSLNYDGKKRFPPFTESTTTRDIITTLTAVIWNASALHSAVNNGQVDFVSRQSRQASELLIVMHTSSAYCTNSAICSMAIFPTLQ